jgi:hypothetical protein
MNSRGFNRPILLLAFILVLGGVLRITGLKWGLESGYGNTRNYQPDEFVSLRGVLHIDLLSGKLDAAGAYFEGTFNYYLWALPQAALKLASKAEGASTASIKTQDHSALLYACRWMSVFFDLCTVIIIFVAIKEATGGSCPALMGALCYAILPMEVIYAHFMRTHLLSNLLCALVIWLSLKFRTRQKWWMLLILGSISGLGAATRYPVGLIVVIPCLYLLSGSGNDLSHSSIGFLERGKRFLAGPAWLIGLGFVAGLFIGHPELFFNSKTVIHAITGETLKYASLQQFNSGKLLNLTTVWKYVAFLIPFALYPLLWLLPYGAICYLCLRRNLLGITLPILLFSLMYLYFMGKGYLVPIFARAGMLLFPGFCFLVGLAYGDLLVSLKKQRFMRILVTIILLALIAPSCAFDWAYVRAMERTDARTALHNDIVRLVGAAPVTIGVDKRPPYFYTSMPAVDSLNGGTVSVKLQDPNQPADFFIVGLLRPVHLEAQRAVIRSVEKSGMFKFEKVYAAPPRLFHHVIDLSAFPSDMTYPFPTLLLFKAAASKSVLSTL